MRWLSSADGSVDAYVTRHAAQVIHPNQPFAGTVGQILSENDALRGAEIAALLQIDHLYKKQFHQCSSGEQQVVRVAYAVLDRPDAIVLIEPFRHLDRYRREHLELLLERLTALGLQIGYTERAKETYRAVPFQTNESTGTPRIGLTNVSYRHPLQGTYAVEDVTFQTEEPGLTVCIGTNGSGKSTLLELMARSKRPLHGKVRRGERGYYVPAEPEYGPFPESAHRRVEQLQAALADVYPVVLLDEPTVDLTDTERQTFVQALQKKAETARIVCATHDASLIEVADDMLYMASGKVVYQGPRSTFQERSTLWSHTSSHS
ncbi:ATP-binding cassette domain-containing protein [Exiguobacterium algae]|uniref:ATP-binding cassette domain-containing protein n=1 Tax=Exiguobacterium algae TaxID=2751250 RepID=UPI001BEB1C9A|nr:ATP-binding cassette domain-containing protein [Exiguobacterium algae]